MDCISFSENGIDICVESVDNVISSIRFINCVNSGRHDSELLSDAKKQITEYFMGTRHELDLPFQETDKDTFAGRVYEIVRRIPYGKTMTYASVADMLGNRNMARAIGNALNKNKIPLITPCHRVIPSSGGTGGFVGGAESKRRLLEIEAGDIV